ncbi:MAG: helix-turn-helix transcriptional regulator [Pseudobutyrivibrio sp.]|nr:helix-turn-helix transcriptional regulator [Pseudobutyrivibrio sp.]
MKENRYSSKELFELINSEAITESESPFIPNKEIADVRKKVLKGFATQAFFEADEDEVPVSYKRATEKSINYYISSGNVSKIKSLIEVMHPLENHYTPTTFTDVGQLSDNPLQQAISMFVCGITVYTRAALDGGLPDHIAYALSDNYIWYGLRLTDIMQLNHLQNCALYDFTNQVYQYKYRKCGIIVKKCCEYILRHLHEKITLQDLADLTSKSTGHISKLFEEELKVRPTIFIREQKLSYAANALEMTDIPVGLLSDLLAFPSTSAFISYFKEKYHVTPLEYRNK